MATQIQSESIVVGRITNKIDRPQANLLVQAFDRDMRNETLLGEGLTDKNGDYLIVYVYNEVPGRGKKTADIALKIYTQSKSLVYESGIDHVRFNASKREEIDVILTLEPPTDEIEHDFVLREISLLADKVNIIELQENSQNRDITFLSKESEIQRGKIEHLVVSHRLSAETQINPAFFYALFRKNTILKNDIANSYQVRLSIGIDSELKPLLYDIVRTDEKLIMRDIAAAVKERIVSDQIAKESKRSIEALKRYQKEADEYYTNEHPRKVVELVSRFVLENKISDLGQALRDNKNDLNAFVTTLTNGTFFSDETKATDAKATVILSNLLGFDNTILNYVKDTQKITKPQDVKKLATLDKTGWRNVLTKSSEKINLAGEPLNKKLVEYHASSLMRKMEKEFPSTAFQAQLAREKKPTLTYHKEINEFLKKHEDFDLKENNLDLFLKEKKLANEKNDGMRNELKSIQRVFKLVPHYAKVNALRKKNIHSAQSIVATGKSRFVKEIAPEAGISTKEANEIFARAENTNTAAMLILGELNDAMSAREIPALEMTSLAPKLEAVSKDFPNLKSLFKLTDVCLCEHCRSVYSPAAYLVEILQFLDKRSVTDLTTNTTAHLAKDVLFSRRPDLRDIDLGCENAETPVPYIDLVCELLEEAVAPDTGINYTGALSDGPDPLTGKISAALLNALTAKGVPVTDQALVFHTEVTSGNSSATLPHYIRDKKSVCKAIHKGGNKYTIFQLRQTLSSAAELAAAPEYVNPKAYTALRTNAFAFSLPFDLNHTEGKAYFSRFGLDRYALMTDFQVAGLTEDKTIAAEKLGLTDDERKLIVTADASAASQKSFWNTTGTAVIEMKIVDTFLTKSGLSFKELDTLLSLQFIDPANSLFIKNLDLSCNTTQKEIAGLDNNALDRIHRFLRLQKKTKWDFDVLDEIISQSKLGNNVLDDATNSCLVKAATLVKISEKTGIKLAELIGFYGVLPHLELSNRSTKPLYHQIFLNKAKNGFIDEGLLPERVNGSQLLSNFKNTLSICLQISTQDIDKLLFILPNYSLTFANLSSLFVYSRLMRKLKLTADDFLLLRELTGIDLQASPQDTLDFVEAVFLSKTLPLKLTDIKFMLKHDALNLVDREIKDEKITSILEKVQAELKKTYIANKSPYDTALKPDEQKEALQNMLSKLSGVEEEDVKTFTNIIDRNWPLPGNTPTDAINFTNSKLNDLFDVTDINTAINTLGTALGPNFETEQNALIKDLMDAISEYQFKIEKQIIVENIISSSFKATTDLTHAVFGYAKLKQPAPGTVMISELLLSDALIDKTNEAQPTITPIAYPSQYDAIRLLHKLFPLLSKFNANNIAWYLENNASLGWFEPDSIPYKASQNPIIYDTFVRFVQLDDLSSRLSPVPNPIDIENPVTFAQLAEMFLPASLATRAQFLEIFSLLTGYEKALVDDFDAHLFPVFNLANYRDIKNWARMEAGLNDLRLLGTTVDQAKAFIKPVLSAADIQLLRMALKARYDEDTWLETLKEITDVIRPQKRNALVAYLLSMNPEMRDENDLYDYFLVDVEMEACMPSSRIVLAHGTVQLFVQRCLMGLEEKAAADLDNDKAWKQWEWMKNYRVWEANRKVFLYPENWIEAELRDDKSFQFQELENELMQNELTDLSAQEGLIRYLEKLDTIAFLEIVATWYQSDIKTMHVFGRTKGGDPATYFYRRFEQERYWTPWEKVDLEISGNHLLAFVRNNRLTLAWPIFSEEPKPTQSSVIPSGTAGTVVENDQPKRKLKIQLAVSEYANKKWQPKKISQDGILTPSDYTTASFFKGAYNLMYLEFTQQVWLFSTSYDYGNEYNNINGIFNVTGCKGYPELVFQGNAYFPDFLPDFRDSKLISQRYSELNTDASDDLAVRNGVSFFAFYQILRQTPGNFRITYPLQATWIDYVALLFQYLVKASYGKANFGSDNRQLKIPLGTLLPYFIEDSYHAYVIIPGFYKTIKEPTTGEPIFVQRTGSDVLLLIEGIIALLVKYIATYQADPTHDLEALVQKLLEDPEYQRIIAEMTELKTMQYGEKFKNMYHPLLCPLRKTLYRDGIPALMKRETQLQQSAFDFSTYYQPTPVVPLKYPVEDIDFDSDGSYSSYNWELFFHVPFLLATRLTQNQKFEESMTWFHYMFNPTGALPGTAPQKYWVTKPFYLRQTAEYVNQRIDTLLYKIADPSTPERAELEFAIDQWRTKPFKPHVIARFRSVAYQKALLMKYIDNLTEWGDYLFRQDTMESIVQATQMYILADKLLGPKPRIIPPVVKSPYETYDQIEARLDAFSNALIDLENILPDLSTLPEGGAELPPPPITLSTLYFCIPPNDQMQAYWDRIADRLFKIRHCQNIDGIERSLALFAPPIDPGMLVRAAAAGLDMSSILAGMNAPTPYYRFTVLAQKATELVQEIRGLGSSLLQALEKKDAEAMSLLRGELELKVLVAVRDLKISQIKEAKQQIEVLKKTKTVTEERNKYYSNIAKIIPKEQLNLDKLSEAHDYQMAAQIIQAGAGVAALIPDLVIGASGFGGSPHAAAKWGGTFLAHAASAAASVVTVLSTAASYEANRASILGGYDRRFDDWKLQERIAKKELVQIDSQIEAAKIRQEISESDLKSHDLQIENAKKTNEFMHDKFTNKDLYEWTIGQISSVYFRAYKLAHDFAKKAERSYKHELGNDDTFISPGYWDSMKKGLQSADILFHDIKRMETSYIDKNKREYEITKNISLALLDPLALIRLRTTGICDFEVPEALFDMDFAGQYFRRLKSVSISLPCIAGPYTSVSARLSLVSNKYRKNTNPGSQYAEDPGNDDRFNYNIGAIQSIATSNAQNDSGMFELNFRDDRYLPFEGTGAISTWRLALPTALHQFDYNTIADVILHFKYTAREGGSSLKNLADSSIKDRLADIKEQLSESGLHTAINLKHDMPNEWHLLKKNSTVDVNVLKNRLPYFAQSLASAIENVIFLAKVKGDPAAYTVNVDAAVVNLSNISDWKLCKGETNTIALDTPFTLSVTGAPALANLEELIMVVKYSF